MSLDVSLYQECELCHHRESFFDYNITHNLGEMAEKAKIYQHLWRPEELGIKYARELIAPLTVGLMELKKSPTKYKRLNPSNGWGTYEALIKFVEKYLDKCIEHPDALIEVDR